MPTIQAKKFFEVQSHINLTGHILDNLTTVIGSPSGKSLPPRSRRSSNRFTRKHRSEPVLLSASPRRKLVDWFKQQGKTVVVPDLKAFREAAVKIHNDASAGAVWTKELYDRLQAVK